MTQDWETFMGSLLFELAGQLEGWRRELKASDLADERRRVLLFFVRRAEALLAGSNRVQ